MSGFCELAIAAVLQCLVVRAMLLFYFPLFSVINDTSLEEILSLRRRAREVPAPRTLLVQSCLSHTVEGGAFPELSACCHSRQDDG